jgi:hypothetical protein
MGCMERTEWASELQAILDSAAIGDHIGIVSAAERFAAFARELGDDFPVVIGYLTPDQLSRAIALAGSARDALADHAAKMDAEMKRRGE